MLRRRLLTVLTIIIIILNVFIVGKSADNTNNNDFRISVYIDGRKEQFLTTDFPNNLIFDSSLFCKSRGYDQSSSECSTTIINYVNRVAGLHSNYNNVSYEEYVKDALNACNNDSPTEDELDFSTQFTHLSPGESHYQAYVGDPKLYGGLGMSQLSLLYASGLQDTNTVLDWGCGSLRLGRLLIPFLSRRNYHCIEPNDWLVRSAIKYELGPCILQIKKPQFYKSYEDIIESHNGTYFDYIMAQSVFSHTFPDLLIQILTNISFKMGSTSVLLATFVVKGVSSADGVYVRSLDGVGVHVDASGTGWLYPGLVVLEESSILLLARRLGLHGSRLAWPYPHQTWCDTYCMYACMYVYIYMYVSIYICIYMYVCVYMYICVCFTYAASRPLVSVCMYVCIKCQS